MIDRRRLRCAGLAAGIGLTIGLMSVAVAPTVKAAEDQPAPDPQSLTDMLGAGDGARSGGRWLPFGQAEMQLSFAPLVRRTAPAVVNVYASQKPRAASPFAGDPLFEQFFGQTPPRAKSSLGSGVLVDVSGIIVTNFHVIQDADQVKVATSDGREFASKTLLKDETIDLAVLKIEGDGKFPTVPIGDSDGLEVGDLVLAMGNPFGVGQTTTSGIVSALARTHIGISDFGFFIQTDAAINPGNSGGALIDMKGQLVGINTAIYSRSGGSIGIGFAIPSNIVRSVVAAAKGGQDVFERPYIGATFEPVTAQIAESLGMDRPTGALVSAVAEKGPAASAGLKAGDVVLSMNGISIENVDALGYRLATQAINATAKLQILSQGVQKTLEVLLERAPEATSTAQVLIKGTSPFAGIKVAELSPRLAQRLNMSSDKTGVTVVDILSDSPAGEVGFEPKDIVREVNGETITTPEQLAAAAAQRTRWWRFTVERNGQLLQQTIRY